MTGQVAPPVVSVLMPVYNAEAFVAKAVESILSQTLTDFEFLIFNDGSTDRSLPILQEYARQDDRIRLFTKPHAGYVKWLNEGLRIARGEFVARMDADDISLPHRFERQAAYLRANPGCAVVGSEVLLIDSDDATLLRVAFPTEHEEIDAIQIEGGFGVIAHPASMLRRESVLSAGGYREEFEPMEDVDLWLRLAEKNRLANLPEVLFKYRQHDANVVFTQAERQRLCADSIINEARLRRGLEPLRESVWNYVAPTVAERHRTWALWAVGSGNRRAAWKHLRIALGAHPLSLRTWYVLCYSLLPRGMRLLLKNLMRTRLLARLRPAGF